MIWRNQKKGYHHLRQLILLIFLVLNCIITGCIEDSSIEHGITSLPEKLKSIDTSIILPDWSDGKYHNYKQTTELLDRFNRNYPNLVKVFSIGKSVEKRDIWCIKLTNEQSCEQKYGCVIDGCIHGSEWESCEICLYFAEYLLINFERNESVTMLLNSSIIYLIPLLNPDGRERDDRYNSNGIDLNRNFDVHFGRLRGKSIPLGKLFGFIKIPFIHLPLVDVTLTNAGRKPFSEPETIALKEFLESLDLNTIGFYLNCHTAVHFIGSVININYKPEYEITPHEQAVLNTAIQWCEEHTEYDGFPVGDSSFYGAGFAHHWVFKEFRIPSFLFELLSLDYEPGLSGGGYHDNLVYWMQESLPILLYLCTNIENLNRWEIPDNEPILPDGIPPSKI